MKINGNLNVFCERCGAKFDLYVNLSLETVSDIKNNAKHMARQLRWTVRADGRAYCTRCAKDIGLRVRHKK